MFGIFLFDNVMDIEFGGIKLVVDYSIFNLSFF